MIFALFVLAWLLLIGVVIAIPVIVTHHDRIFVMLMRRFDIQACPEAVAIALLIYQQPEQWTCGTHRMSHPKVGEIWTANEAYGLHVETEFGQWKPSKIERRIIRNAVDWRIKEYVKNRIAHALNAGLLQ